jgi:ABC-type dipeptide/oligopeptide/nickel transport system ATPase component
VNALTEEELRQLRARELGFIFSNPQSSMNPLARVGHQVADRYRIAFGLDRRAALVRAHEMLEAVGYRDAVARSRAYPHELSGGMAQRVAIARALAVDPRLVIADEPTSGLDVTIQRQILDLLASHVRERRMSMVLVTHDLGVVAHYCDRVIVMYAGEVAEDTPADEFFREPRHPYSQRLLQASRGGLSQHWERLLDDPSGAVSR